MIDYLRCLVLAGITGAFFGLWQNNFDAAGFMTMFAFIMQKEK